MDRRQFFTLTGAIALAGNTAHAAQTAHDFGFENIEGGTLPLSQFAGQPVLIVNTASRCAFTHQYNALQALYDQYRDLGLVVLGVPSDDFGAQELATEAEVKHFCEVNFAIDFPMTTITRVQGRNAHPFYTWAEQDLGSAKAPRWNFHKYLVDPDGALIAAFDTTVPPDARQITEAIEKLLAS